METAVDYNKSFQRLCYLINTFNFFELLLMTIEKAELGKDRRVSASLIMSQKAGLYFDNLRKPMWSQYLTPGRKF